MTRGWTDRPGPIGQSRGTLLKAIFTSPDFVKIAEGHGCDALRVSKASELASALKRALAHKGTSLVEVIVDSAVPMLYARQGRV